MQLPEMDRARDIYVVQSKGREENTDRMEFPQAFFATDYYGLCRPKKTA